MTNEEPLPPLRVLSGFPPNARSPPRASNKNEGIPLGPCPGGLRGILRIQEIAQNPKSDIATRPPRQRASPTEGSCPGCRHHMSSCTSVQGKRWSPKSLRKSASNARAPHRIASTSRPGNRDASSCCARRHPRQVHSKKSRWKQSASAVNGPPSPSVETPYCSHKSKVLLQSTRSLLNSASIEAVIFAPSSSSRPQVHPMQRL